MQQQEFETARRHKTCGGQGCGSNSYLAGASVVRAVHRDAFTSAALFAGSDNQGTFQAY